MSKIFTQMALVLLGIALVCADWFIWSTGLTLALKMGCSLLLVAIMLFVLALD